MSKNKTHRVIFHTTGGQSFAASWTTEHKALKQIENIASDLERAEQVRITNGEDDVTAVIPVKHITAATIEEN